MMDDVKQRLSGLSTAELERLLDQRIGVGVDLAADGSDTTVIGHWVKDVFVVDRVHRDRAPRIKAERLTPEANGAVVGDVLTDNPDLLTAASIFDAVCRLRGYCSDPDRHFHGERGTVDISKLRPVGPAVPDVAP